MLARVQVDHEIDQRAFQSRACTGETNEAAPAEFGRPIGIEQLQFCAEGNVIFRLGELRFVAPAPYDAVRTGVFANWNTLIRQIGDLEK